MKKFLFTLTLFCSLFTATALANEVKVNPQVMGTFNTTFSNAENVKWALVKNLYQAQFTIDNEQYSAYFDNEGKMLVLARFITPNQLPASLKLSLNNEAQDGVISFVFELTDEEGTHYYATIQKGDKKEMLRSSGSKNWSPYNKAKI